MNPQAEGTLISDLQDDNIIKAIAAKDNIFYVKFESKHNLCPHQFIIDNSEHLCKILAELEQYAKILMGRSHVHCVRGGKHALGSMPVSKHRL